VKTELWTVRTMKLWRIDTEIQTNAQRCVHGRGWTFRLRVRVQYACSAMITAERKTEMCTLMTTVMEEQTEGRMVYPCKGGEMEKP